jgi:large subunit ribosomal protein L3
MTLGLLGTKIGMTQLFNIKGEIIPVTIIKTGPCYVTQIKNTENSGYNAIQLGYIGNFKKPTTLTKPEKGHLYKIQLPSFPYLKEYKLLNIENFKLGQIIDVEFFKIGQLIKITGLTIGKGNIGNIKQHNFNSGPMAHGSKHHRLQGSLGAGTTPGRVFPGKRMPSRLGNKKVTIKGLEILDIDKKENIVVIKGSTPGKSGTLLNLT